MEFMDVVAKVMPVIGFLIGLVWLTVPVAIFGIKPRLEALIEQQKETNRLLSELAARRGAETSPPR